MGSALYESAEWHVTPTGRAFARAPLPETEGWVYLLEALEAEEEAPSHPNLPEVSGTLEVDGRRFWMLNPPNGSALPEVLREEDGAPEAALSRVRSLAEGLLLARAIAGLPANFYEQIYWAEGELVLDYLEALTGTARPSFPQLEGVEPATAAAMTLGAVLHSCYTGKPACDPPYVFLALAQFGIAEEPEVQELLTASLGGRLSLEAVVQGIQAEERCQRMVSLFPPHVQPSVAEPPRPSPQGSQTNQWIDLVIWLTCMVAGLLVLARSMI